MQQRFEFPVETHVVPARSGDSKVYTGAQVARRRHRMEAAAWDAGVIVLSVLTLAGVMQLFGVTDKLGNQTLPLFGAALVLTTLLYRAFWAAVGADTFGTRQAGLVLVTFDGRQLARRHRIDRIWASCLSIAPLGVGLLWALGDESAFTWQDHMSKSFPTSLDQRRVLPRS